MPHAHASGFPSPSFMHAQSNARGETHSDARMETSEGPRATGTSRPGERNRDQEVSPTGEGEWNCRKFLDFGPGSQV